MQSLEQLLREQRGLVARRQLNDRGVDWGRVRNNLAAGRWAERTPRVISVTTGTLDPTQRLWLAVLHAGPRSMLGGLTAAATHGLDGWPRRQVCVLVDDELAFEPVDGVRFFRTRRPYERLRSPRPGLPRCHLEPAVLLWAAYEAEPRAAHGILAAVVQQRLTTAARLVEWVDQLRPLRRAKPFKATLSSIDDGVQSMAELDVRRMCLRFAMPFPLRQRPRTDRAGKVRWTDCEWDLPDGSVLVLGVDGSFHMEALEWRADLRRARRITTSTRTILRCSAFELRHEPGEVAIDLVALGLPGRVPGAAA
ncbi:hypothetical protein [Nocardioides lijunqiniae]|uniref:hypothetical protein n=1 Tax=Nocardioides lijunqiniae TaxID=2760832 RepID=UPI001878500D|nr:hypothetical protein [Nocardioides lijunqiniae]